MDTTPPATEDRAAPTGTGRSLLWPTVGIVAAGGATALFLTTVDPGSANPLAAAYLGCPSRTWFGVLCPLCGGTRAARAVVTGDVGAVWRLNLVLPVLLALGAWAYLAAATRGWRRGRVPPVPRTRGFWLPLGMLTALYGVLRNLPFEPFTLLAP